MGGVTGTRLPDTRHGELPDGAFDTPGAYWKYLNARGEPMRPPTIDQGLAMGNLTGTVWGIVAPDGSIGTLMYHTVREHEDGTISVRPGDGTSNSILIHPDASGPGWHGYIERGVWSEC